MAELFTTLVAIFFVIALVVSMGIFGILLGPIVWFLGMLPIVAIGQSIIRRGEDHYYRN